MNMLLTRLFARLLARFVSIVVSPPHVPGNIMMLSLPLTLLSRMTVTGLLPPAACPRSFEITLVIYIGPLLLILMRCILLAVSAPLQLPRILLSAKLCVPDSVHLQGCSGRLEMQRFSILCLRVSPSAWLYLIGSGLGVLPLNFEFLMLLNRLNTESRLVVWLPRCPVVVLRTPVGPPPLMNLTSRWCGQFAELKVFFPTRVLTMWWPYAFALMWLMRLRRPPNVLLCLCLLTTVLVMFLFML